MKKNNYPKKKVQRFTKAKDCVILDGHEKVFEGTNNECFQWLLKHQGQSTYYATTDGTYSVIAKKDYDKIKSGKLQV